jgi:starvation-inducible DNA-binding protein
VLLVADDGVGPGDLTQGGGQGCRIVRGLADVLGGNVLWHQSTVLGGTEVILRFPLPAMTTTFADIAVPAESGGLTVLSPSISKQRVRRSHSAYKWSSAAKDKARFDVAVRRSYSEAPAAPIEPSAAGGRRARIETQQTLPEKELNVMVQRNQTQDVPPALATPSDLGANATRDIAAALNGVLADVFALYLKTKNFHWHMSGPHFRDYHLMLDEQSDQIFAMTDVLAERVRKIGQLTLHSIGEISRTQRIADNDARYVTPQDMLAELREDNGELAKRMRQAHEMIDEQKDVATASLLEVFIDETERRAWFLYEASHHTPET